VQVAATQHIAMADFLVIVAFIYIFLYLGIN
jgi:hypothetical protein